MRRILAESNSTDEDKQIIQDQFVKEFDNLTEISEPKIAPNEIHLP